MASEIPAGETSRERILRVAAELFARNGYAGTGIGELSSEVGLARAALYHHISSKEELLRDISVSLLEDAGRRARAIVDDPDQDPVAKIRLLARDLVREHAERGDVWHVAISEAGALSAEHRAQVVAARDAYEEVWVEALEAGARSGDLLPVGDVERRAILGSLNSTTRWMNPDGALSPEDVADRHVELFLRGIATGPRF